MSHNSQGRSHAVMIARHRSAKLSSTMFLTVYVKVWLVICFDLRSFDSDA